MTKGYRRPIKLWQSAIFKTLSDSKKIYPTQAPDFRVLYRKYDTPGARAGDFLLGGGEILVFVDECDFGTVRRGFFFGNMPLFLRIADRCDWAATRPLSQTK